MLDKTNNEFEINSYSRRVESLETFKSEHEGEKFHSKVVDSINKSKEVEAAIIKVIWCAIREKIVWIIVGGFITLLGAFIVGFVQQFGANVANSVTKSNQTQIETNN